MIFSRFIQKSRRILKAIVAEVIIVIYCTTMPTADNRLVTVGTSSIVLNVIEFGNTSIGRVNSNCIVVRNNSVIEQTVSYIPVGQY